MKSMKTSIKSLILIGACITLVIACKKDSNSGTTTSNDDAANLSASATTADNSYSDVFNVALQASSDHSVQLESVHTAYNSGIQMDNANATTSTHTASICATVTIDTTVNTTWPKTVTLDFGTTGCTGIDGVTRKGVVTLVFTGRLLTPGSTVTATFANYYVNGYKLEGTYTIHNNTSAGGVSFTTTSTGGKITFPDASFYTYSGTKTVSQSAGASTPLDFTDDEYTVTGNHSVASSTGKTLVSTVESAHPLLVKLTCRHIVSGIVDFTYDSLVDGTLDYGTGTCDDQAVITIGTKTKTITLP